MSTRHFQSRAVVVVGKINHTTLLRTVHHMVAFYQDKDDPITLIISSLSGCVESGDIVHDIIKFIRPRARAIGSGCVASAEALIFAVAKKEYRYFLLNIRFSSSNQ